MNIITFGGMPLDSFRFAELARDKIKIPNALGIFILVALPSFAKATADRGGESSAGGGSIFLSKNQGKIETPIYGFSSPITLLKQKTSTTRVKVFCW